MEVPRVASDHGQVMDQGGCRDQLVQGAFMTRHAQATPNGCDVGVDVQYVVGVVAEQSRQPVFEAGCLPPIAAVADQFHAPAQLSDCDGGQKKWPLLMPGIGKEVLYTGISVGPLADFTDDVRVNQIAPDMQAALKAVKTSR